MSAGTPRLLARPPGEPGTLAGDLVRGEPGARSLLPEGRLTPAGEPVAPGEVPVTRTEGRLPLASVRAFREETRERAAAVLAGEGTFVTTGQQPVLFLGPLYVLYKALTAVSVARALEDDGRTAVPLFWVAGDDHDWDEVARTRVLDLANELRELRLAPPEGRAGRSVGASPLPGVVEGRIEDMEEALPDSEFIDDYLELLRDRWRPGTSFSEAFGRTLEALLPEAGLAWLDASAPAVRRAEAPLFSRVLEEAGAVEDRMQEGVRRLRSAGREPPVRRETGALPLFVDTQGGRRRLRREGDVFRIGREGPETTADELHRLLDEAPERFSPDVALRPVAASWLLPTGVTVLGPSELAYWTQLPELFDWAGVPMPRLRPRDGWTVLEAKVAKVLEKLDADPGAFADGGRELARAVREEGRPEAVEEALSEARAGVARALSGVEEAVGRELPGIRSAVGAARHQAFEVLDELASAVDERVDEQHEVVLGQIRKAARHLWPDGRPQERVLSPFYYLARYGRTFLEELERRALRRARGEGGE